jgi:hypothetical protein
VHSSPFGVQAMPTFEHDTSPPAARWQTRQPSVHSRHVRPGLPVWRRQATPAPLSAEPGAAPV